MQECEVVMGKGLHAIPTSGTKGQVLVVDDDEAIRSLLSRTLSFIGYDVSHAGNGLEASTLFFTGSYDLVVTDFEMPLMNGWELARLVKEQSPHTPVIVITGTRDDKHWEKLNTRYVDAIIPKPFRLKEIQETVHTLLNH
jgi:CheY-like chemotaxis protein